MEPEDSLPHSPAPARWTFDSLKVTEDGNSQRRKHEYKFVTK
jgi:hypothetical protein